MKFVFVTADAEDLKSRLLSDQVSPIAYNSGKPEQLLSEDREIQELALGFDAVDVVPAAEIFQ